MPVSSIEFTIILHGGSAGWTLALALAQVCLQPPDPFNFKVPDDWPRWEWQFGQSRVTSGLTEGPDKKLSLANATKEDRANYDQVIGKFNQK